MSKKDVTRFPKKSLRVIARLSFFIPLIASLSTGYVNNQLSSEDYSDTFFRTIYLGAAIASLLAASIMVYYVFQHISWKERAIFIVLISASAIIALEDLFAGLLVGAFTNF